MRWGSSVPFATAVPWHSIGGRGTRSCGTSIAGGRPGALVPDRVAPAVRRGAASFQPRAPECRSVASAGAQTWHAVCQCDCYDQRRTRCALPSSGWPNRRKRLCGGLPASLILETTIKIRCFGGRGGPAKTVCKAQLSKRPPGERRLPANRCQLLTAVLAVAVG